VKIIKKISHQIKEEAEGAMEYAKCAVHYKDEYPDLARAYAEMAEQELGHANKLHDFVVKFIAKARETVEPPKWMLEMWDEEHREIVEEVAKAKAMITMIQR
jgi:ferritin